MYRRCIGTPGGRDGRPLTCCVRRCIETPGGGEGRPLTCCVYVDALVVWKLNLWTSLNTFKLCECFFELGECLSKKERHAFKHEANMSKLQPVTPNSHLNPCCKQMWVLQFVLPSPVSSSLNHLPRAGPRKAQIRNYGANSMKCNLNIENGLFN